MTVPGSSRPGGQDARDPGPSLEAPGDPAAGRPQLVRALGPLEGVCIVVGTTIGSGIFITPAKIAENVGPFGFGAILGVWVICGLLSLAGALVYAELAAMFPRAGGQYVYLREAYGPLWGFLYGWMEFWVARAGSCAALGVAFARYAAVFTGGEGDWAQRWTAFLVVVILTCVNYAGVRWGGTVQTVFTATKVFALAALVVCAFALPGGSAENWQPFTNAGGWERLGFAGLAAGLGVAMIQSLWAYDGWANAATVSEEMKNPQRDTPRALVGGTLLIIGLYLAANLAYHYVLPLGQVAAAERVAADVAGTLLNPELGVRLLAAAVMISTFGALNGVMLTGPRVFYAMARDRMFFSQLGELHGTFRSPHIAILFQGLWAAALILIPFDALLNPLFHWKEDARLYDQMLTFVIFGSWGFYAMTVWAVVRLRKLRPELDRPYRTWGYPVTPILFLATSMAFMVNALREQPGEALAGLVLVGLGVPVYFKFRKGSNAV
jgi:APA family basic amino acid/polyamine antiporter